MPRRGGGRGAGGGRVLRVTAPAPPPAPPPSDCRPAADGRPAADVADVAGIPLAALSISDPAAPRTGRAAPAASFPFLRLPSELRLKVYGHHFGSAPRVIDLDPDNQRRIRPLFAIARACRLVHDEAVHQFWSTRVIRIFPTYPGRFFKTRKPLLARLRDGQRASLSALELRLGPGWSSPPRGWAVTEALGLSMCAAVRRLVVFLECDPSDSVFRGFRREGGFYEKFSQELLAGVLAGLPSVAVVEFDAYPSVKKSGEMMRALLELVSSHPGRLAIRWGPDRGWTDSDDDEEEVGEDEPAGPQEEDRAAPAADDGLGVGAPAVGPSVSFGAGHGPQSIMAAA